MGGRFRAFAALLLVAAVLQAGWLLLNPEAGEVPAAPAAGVSLPSLEPILSLAGEGREVDAITALAAAVRSAPALADKGGALASSAPLRGLVLAGWKGIVASAGERAPQVEKDIRFLQRRLAGGCS